MPSLTIHRILVFALTATPLCFIAWATGLVLSENWGLAEPHSSVFSWGVGIGVGVAMLALLTCLGGHLAAAQTRSEAWTAPMRALRDMFRFLSLAVF